MKIKDADPSAAWPNGQPGLVEGEPWLWLALVSVIAFMLVGGMLTSLTVYTTTMQVAFGWTKAAMGGGPAALLLGMSVGNIIAHRVARWRGVRAAFSVGIAVAAVGWISAGFVPALPEFVAACAVSGVGIGIGSYVLGLALISASFRAHKGLAMGVFIGATALASSVMPLLTEVMVAKFGWRVSFWAVGAVAVVLGLALARGLPARVRGITDAPPRGRTAEAFVGALPSRVFRLRGYWLLLLALAVCQVSLNGVLFNVVDYLHRSGYDLSSAVRVYSLANFMSLPGLLLGGWLSDRVDPHMVLSIILAVLVIGVAALLGVQHPGLGLASIAAFVVVWGGASGLPVQAGSMVLSGMVEAHAYTAALAVIFTTIGIVGAAGPALVGLVYDATSGYFWPVLVLVFLALVATVLSMGARPRAIHGPSTETV